MIDDRVRGPAGSRLGTIQQFHSACMSADNRQLGVHEYSSLRCRYMAPIYAVAASQSQLAHPADAFHSATLV